MREITFAEAIREAMSEEMRKDPTVFVMGEDIGVYGGAFGVTRGMLAEFGPERVKDTPISEAAIVGSAAGAAVTGMRPIAELMYVDFATIGMDQLVNQAAKIRYMFGGKAKVPMVLRAPCGAGRGNAAQHSQSLEAFFVHVPGLKVVMPSTPYDAKGLLKSSIRDDNPVVFLEHKMLYNFKGPVPEEEYTIPLGVADIKREGRDVTVIATSMIVHKALNAAAELEKEGISVEVIDPRTLKPLDIDTLVRSVKKTKHVIVAHEAVKTNGFGAEVVAVLVENAFDYLDAPIIRVTAPDTPVPYSRPLEDDFIPQERDIISAIKEIL